MCLKSRTVVSEVCPMCPKSRTVASKPLSLAPLGLPRGRSSPGPWKPSLAGRLKTLHFQYNSFCELDSSGSGGCPGTFGFPRGWSPGAPGTPLAWQAWGSLRLDLHFVV